MRRAVALYRSSIGKKMMMAVTGLILFLFVVGHMVGNLKIFAGPAKFDAYAAFLREIGVPLAGHAQVLWTLRLVLLASVVIHVVAAIQLARMSHDARPVKYRRSLVPDASTYASRTMRWGGLIIAAFVTYHLLHFTFGSVHPDFVEGAVYHNVVVGFQNPIVAGAYIVAVGVLGLHLYHGLWSTFQTLGASHPVYNRYRRPAAAVIALALFLGFATVPVAVWAGAVR